MTLNFYKMTDTVLLMPLEDILSLETNNIDVKEFQNIMSEDDFIIKEDDDVIKLIENSMNTVHKLNEMGYNRLSNISRDLIRIVFLRENSEYNFTIDAHLIFISIITGIFYYNSNKNTKSNHSVPVTLNDGIYIRFGKIPNNHKSYMFYNDYIIGEEMGLVVFDAAIIRNKLRVVLPETMTKNSINYINKCIQFNEVYLVTGVYIGNGIFGDTLIKNVKVLYRLDNFDIYKDTEFFNDEENNYSLDDLDGCDSNNLYWIYVNNKWVKSSKKFFKEYKGIKKKFDCKPNDEDINNLKTTITSDEDIRNRLNKIPLYELVDIIRTHSDIPNCISFRKRLKEYYRINQTKIGYCKTVLEDIEYTLEYFIENGGFDNTLSDISEDIIVNKFSEYNVCHIKRNRIYYVFMSYLYSIMYVLNME